MLKHVLFLWSEELLWHIQWGYYFQQKGSNALLLIKTESQEWLWKSLCWGLPDPKCQWNLHGPKIRSIQVRGKVHALRAQWGSIVIGTHKGQCHKKWTAFHLFVQRSFWLIQNILFSYVRWEFDHFGSDPFWATTGSIILSRDLFSAFDFFGA